MKKQEYKPTVFRVFYFVLLCTIIGFGGGNALLPIINKIAVKKYKWITESEFDDAAIASNMIPGSSVIQTLSFVAIKCLGFWKGMFVTLLAVIPHLLIALAIFILLRIYAIQYLYVIAASVLPVIIGVIINFGLRYLKSDRQHLNIPLWFGLFIITFTFCLFVPAPYNIPAIPIVLVVIFIAFYALFKHLKNKKSKSRGEQ
ncbi:chromate transporter [[Mycoplasma] gypis]|uniref:Chromate transporter n=1 Tax=[Mycoplasma] gypis TaxID=92404 RepID=A0ABZ2RSY6_9BACT|nr:chromate transporter [[Mycoplasma] gypis]MBN0919073.1 chromate transporter [[Mycoplasma] gypis]